jgi:hypothetical protein
MNTSLNGTTELPKYERSLRPTRCYKEGFLIMGNET